MDILVCPVCRGELELTIEAQDDEEIVSGSLFCEKGKVSYQIEDSIPVLLAQDDHK